MWTYLDAFTQQSRCLVLFIGRFDDEVSGQRCELTQLLLELFRILFQMLEDAIVSLCNETDGGDICKDAS